MNIEKRFYETLLIQFDDLKISVDGNLSASIATILREEFPERQEPKGKFLAFNKDSRKGMMIDDDSLQLRDDHVPLIDESVTFIVNTLMELPNTVGWQQGVVTIVTMGKLPLEKTEEVQTLLADKLVARGIDTSKLPGSPMAGMTGIMLHRDDAHLQFSLETDYEDSVPGLAFEFAITWEGMAESISHVKTLFEGHAVELERVLRLLRDW